MREREFAKEDDRKSYIQFLSSLLKDKPYVAFAYMTGILPIAKYSSGSDLNMFLEYTMATKERYCGYFGFDDSEVDELYQRYVSRTDEVKIRREDLRAWYDGYHTMSGVRLYNPRSVTAALTDNQLGNYWTSCGPYDEIFYYIEKNTAAVNLVYLAARDFYRIEREDKAGIGYADFIFYPETDQTADCLILELKIGHTPEEAIRQIKKRKYALRFEGKLGEKPLYSGRILAAGIAYDRKTKKHCCRVEVLERK